MRKVQTVGASHIWNIWSQYCDRYIVSAIETNRGHETLKVPPFEGLKLLRRSTYFIHASFFRPGQASYHGHKPTIEVSEGGSKLGIDNPFVRMQKVAHATNITQSDAFTRQKRPRLEKAKNNFASLLGNNTHTFKRCNLFTLIYNYCACCMCCVVSFIHKLRSWPSSDSQPNALFCAPVKDLYL